MSGRNCAAWNKETLSSPKYNTQPKGGRAAHTTALWCVAAGGGCDEECFSVMICNFEDWGCIIGHTNCEGGYTFVPRQPQDGY